MYLSNNDKCPSCRQDLKRKGFPEDPKENANATQRQQHLNGTINSVGQTTKLLKLSVPTLALLMVAEFIVAYAQFLYTVNCSSFNLPYKLCISWISILAVFTFITVYSLYKGLGNHVCGWVMLFSYTITIAQLYFVPYPWLPVSNGTKSCDETVLSFTGAGPHNINWEGCGFRLLVPPGAVHENVTVNVAVKAFLPVAGKIKRPENFHFISPIYKISSSNVFLKNVSIQIQHYAVISSAEETSHYGFFKGRLSDTGHVQSFDMLDGEFSLHSQLANTSLKHFSAPAAVGNSSRPTKEYKYAAHAYHKYHPAQPNRLDFVFLLTPSQDKYLTDLKEEYMYSGWDESVKSFEIKFEEGAKSIFLEIKVIDKGQLTDLEIQEISALEIDKKYVTDLAENIIANIPSCEVAFLYKLELQGSNMQPMRFHVKLKGASPPRNFFYVVVAPPPMQPCQTSGVQTNLHKIGVLVLALAVIVVIIVLLLVPVITQYRWHIIVAMLIVLFVLLRSNIKYALENFPTICDMYLNLAGFFPYIMNLLIKLIS